MIWRALLAYPILWRARAARDAGRHRHAANLFAIATRIEPDRASTRFQLGNMFKDSGDDTRAEAAYEEVLRLRPGHADAWRHLVHIDDRRHEAAADDESPIDAALVPTLAPRPRAAMVRRQAEQIVVRRLGRDERGPWGMRRTLRGIEAIHGFCLSIVRVTTLVVLIDDEPFHTVAMMPGHRADTEPEGGPLAKYVFNEWVEVSTLAYGRHRIELRLIREDGTILSFGDIVVIAPPIPETEFPESDALIARISGDPGPVNELVRARPSMVRPAARAAFPHGVRSILVLRTDQLGDLIASIPALLRLRALAPEARIVGLLTAANADLGRVSGLFDEIIEIAFPDDPAERRRIMPLDQQEELRRRLAPYAFDVAIDLARSDVSRELLLLTGARLLHGRGDRPWLDSGGEMRIADRWTDRDSNPHATEVLALVEAFGALVAPPQPVIRRPDLSRDRLERYGLRANARYVVLHLGARIAFSRWPYYAELARMLIDAEPDLTIVTVTEDARTRGTLAEDLLGHPRHILIDRRLPFDDFDALLSFAAVVVGNDSGPKHLAALRGTEVVTLYSARIDWREWSQEGIGVVISRRVPCAGCAILHDAEECGRDFACIRDIRPSEVFDAVTAALRRVDAQTRIGIST